jgi:carbon storage regulator
MLVLSRKIGERILIGDKIAVTVVKIAPGIVRIGVEAPADMAIVREEILKEPSADDAGEPEVRSASKG